MLNVISKKTQSTLPKTDTFGNGTVSVFMAQTLKKSFVGLNMARDVARPLRGLKRLAPLAKRSTEGRCPKGSWPSGDENNYRHDISSAYKSFRFSFQFHFSIMVTENELCSALKGQVMFIVWRGYHAPQAGSFDSSVNTIGTSLWNCLAPRRSFSTKFWPLIFLFPIVPCINSHSRFALTSVRKTKHLRRRQTLERNSFRNESQSGII